MCSLSDSRPIGSLSFHKDERTMTRSFPALALGGTRSALVSSPTLLLQLHRGPAVSTDLKFFEFCLYVSVEVTHSRFTDRFLLFIF